MPGDTPRPISKLYHYPRETRRCGPVKLLLLETPFFTRGLTRKAVSIIASFYELVAKSPVGSTDATVLNIDTSQFRNSDEDMEQLCWMLSRRYRDCRVVVTSG